MLINKRNKSFIIYRLKTALAIMAISFVLIACSSKKSTTEQDNAPKGSFNHHSVPNAVPKHEPRSPYGNPASYVVFDKRYYLLDTHHGYKERGLASWYGTKFHGRRTSSGETYDMYSMTAAHKTLPIPAYVKVTNLENGKEIIVKINDRGPFHEGRIIDLSYVAALKLDVVKTGTARVEVETISPGYSPSPKPATSTAAPNSMWLQAAAFQEISNANALAEVLRAQMNSEQVVVIEDKAQKQTPYLVHVGPVNGNNEIALRQTIYSLTQQEPWLIR